MYLKYACERTQIMQKRSMLVAMVLGTLVAALGQLPAAHAQASKAQAEKKEAVVIQLTQKRVVSGPQGERLEDINSVKPGDVIEYRATYTNVSKLPVQGLVAKLPVPEGLEYLPKSAKPYTPALQMAARDGQFGVEPLQRKTADGSVQLLPYNEYRTMRWNIGQLNAGASVAVSARARVEGAVPAPVTASPVASTPRSLESSRP
jgi:uncharacterized repeat protein (TIGR01451 family)